MVDLAKLSKGSKQMVFSHSVDPVYEEMLTQERKVITNQQIDQYNDAALSTLNSNKRNGKARVKILSASRAAAMETITQSKDGLHMPEGTRDVVSTMAVKPVFACSPRLFS